MWRTITELAGSIAKRYHQFIKFPITPEEQDEVAEGFLNACGSPGIMGIIDNVAIKLAEKPQFENISSEKAEKFFGRKGSYAFNACGIVNHKKQFIYFSTWKPGSTHDSRIFNESWLRIWLDRQFNAKKPRYLIGDEGFGVSNVLLAPIQDGRANTGRN